MRQCIGRIYGFVFSVLQNVGRYGNDFKYATTASAFAGVSRKRGIGGSGTLPLVVMPSVNRCTP